MRPQQKPRLREQFFSACRVLNRSPKTAEAYWSWVVRYLRFFVSPAGVWTHPTGLGPRDVELFLTHLARDRNVAPSTQNQALQAILFLYHRVLKIEINGVDALRAKPNRYLPTVLSREETLALFEQLQGRDKLIAALCYSAGLRIGEVFELRLKDLDLARRVIHVRQAKGHKDRIVPLAQELMPLLLPQIELTKHWHQVDIADGCARVPLPYAFERKCPRAASELGWYWLFCSAYRSKEPSTGRIGRFHLDPSTFTRGFSEAVRRAKIWKRVTAHTLRHTFATHLLDDRVDIVTIKELLGHESLETTQIYAHAKLGGVASTRSPFDSLLSAR